MLRQLLDESLSQREYREIEEHLEECQPCKDTLDELTAFGTPAEARERLARWHAAGADMPLVFLRPNLAPEQIERTLAAFAPMLESRS